MKAKTYFYHVTICCLLVLFNLSVPAFSAAESADGLVIDFGSSGSDPGPGLWYYDGSPYLDRFTGSDVTDMVAFGDKIAVTCFNDNCGMDYDGLCSFDPWISLPPIPPSSPFTLISSDPNEGYVAYIDGLAIDFGTTGSDPGPGLWFYNDSLPWEEMTWADVRQIVAFGDKLAATCVDDKCDPNPDGLYVYTYGVYPPWTQISTDPNEGYIPYNGGLVIDLGTEGLHFFDGLPLEQMTWVDVTEIVAFGDKLAATCVDDKCDPNPDGLYVYTHGVSPPWTQIATDPNEGYFKCGNGLAIDYGTQGLWFYDGTLPLKEITGNNVSNPIVLGNKVAVTNLGRVQVYDPDSKPHWTTITEEPNEGYIAYGDSEDDGMPDWWEREHGLDLTFDDALEDPDVDGLTNIDEYTVGTDPTLSSNDVYVVNPGYTSCYASIQEAIDAVTEPYEGKKVYVTDGIYTGTGNYDIQLDKSITIRSVNGSDNCTINCEGNGRGFFLNNQEAENSVISGFTIQNGSEMYGSGLYLSISATIKSCKIINNSSSVNGGGIFISDASPKIEDCTITSNNASIYAGGIAVSGTEASPTITACIISGNTCTQKGGGVTSSNGSSPIITNCIISGNSSDQSGGGIAVFESSPAIINCTVTENITAASSGGGFYSQTSPSTSIKNSIFWNNSPDELGGYGGDPGVTYSCIESGYAGEGNIDTDPQFYTTANGDYCLSQAGYGSPCLDAGTGGTDVPLTDIWGHARPQGTKIDMGAYETLLNDTDEDGIADYWERRYFNDLDQAQTTDFDSDGMPDGWEYKYGLNPTIDDSSGDLDGDGKSNIDEYNNGTPPDNYAPSITITNPSGDCQIAYDEYTIKWTDIDPDDNADIYLFYDANNNFDDEDEFDLFETEEDPDGPGNDEYIWDTWEADEGSYYIGAEIYDGLDDSVFYTEYPVVVKRLYTENTVMDEEDIANSVAIDGSWAVVGTPYADPLEFRHAGMVTILRKDNSGWEKFAVLGEEDGQNNISEKFGYAVDIDGDYIIVGSAELYGQDPTKYNYALSGGISFFHWNGSEWIPMLGLSEFIPFYNKIRSHDWFPGDHFAKTVAISGEYAAAGSRWATNDEGIKTGAVYVYKRTGSNWAYHSKLTASDGEFGNWFGNKVSMSGNHMIISAQGVDSVGTNAGAVYIFELNTSNGQWEQKDKLIPQYPSDFHFGHSVSIDGDTAIVGTQPWSRHGWAYIFERNSGTGHWEQADILGPPDVGLYDISNQFGYSVSVNNGYAVVGAREDSDEEEDAGSIYVYKNEGGTWNYLTEIHSIPEQYDDIEHILHFGHAVDNDGNTAIVGRFGSGDHFDPGGTAEPNASIIRLNDQASIPVITIEGENPALVCVGSTYNDEGALAWDEYYGDISFDIVADNQVNMSTPGDYTVTYNVCNIECGCAVPVERDVYVRDNPSPPTVTLNGEAFITLCEGENYVEENVTAIDACGNIIPIEEILITGSVDTSNAGVYTLTYTAVSGPHSTSVDRQITVEDSSNPPVITLNGENPVSICHHCIYEDAGATALDDCEGDLSAVIITNSTVNTADLSGSPYTVTYDVNDSLGNLSTVTRTVNIVTNENEPVITLNGSVTINMVQGNNYVDEGATAWDDDQGDLTGLIAIAGLPDNTSPPGEYIVTYNVEDSAHNAAVEVTRTVNIIAANRGHISYQYDPLGRIQSIVRQHEAVTP